MAQVLEDIVVRLALKQIEAKVVAPKVEPVKREVGSLEKTITDTNRKMGESFDTVGKEIEATASKVVEVGRKQTQAAEEISRAQGAAADAAFRAGDAYKAAGEGALTLARGVALAAASLDDDLAKALQKYVLPAQAALDIFKGTFEVTKSLREARKALTAATAAQAAAETTLATATTATSAASSGLLATIGGAALKFGPWLAVLGTAAKLLWDWKTALDAQSAAQERALELDRQSLEIRMRRRKAIEEQTQALKDLASQQRAERQGEANEVFQVQLERARTFDPAQRLQALQGLDTGVLATERAGLGIEQLMQAGRREDAQQLLEDRESQIQNELTRLREMLTTERQIAAEKERQAQIQTTRSLEQAQARGASPQEIDQIKNQGQSLVAEITAKLEEVQDERLAQERRLLEMLERTLQHQHANKRELEMAAVVEDS